MEECDFNSHALRILMEECDFNSHVQGEDFTGQDEGKNDSTLKSMIQVKFMM